MKKLLIIALTIITLFCGRAIADDMTIAWSDTVEAGDTASVDTTIAYSDEYPIYGWADNQPYKYYYISFIVKAIPTIQQTRNCSVTVAIQYRPNNSTTWKLFDSLTVDAVVRDTTILRSKRMALDSITADSLLPRARWLRAKATKSVTYVAADTLIVGKIYDFDVVVDAVGRY